MSTLTPKNLYTGNDLASNVYTVSSTANSYTIIKSINISNTSAVDKTFSLHIIASSGTPAASNKIMSSITVPGNNVLSSDTVFVLNSDESLYFDPVDANLTLHVSGAEFLP